MQPNCSIRPLLNKAPAEWTGSSFGGFNKRGWMRRSGVGRIFEDWHDPNVEAVQEACRDLAASLHRVPPNSLHRVHERCSIKVPGCPEFGAHLDRQRENTFQIIVALTDTKFLLWPGSHRHEIAIDEAGYYELEPEEIEALPQTRTEVDVVAGDVCVMVGGKLVHGSIAVTSGVQIMTYAHYQTSAASAGISKPRLGSKLKQDDRGREGQAEDRAKKPSKKGVGAKDPTT